MDGCSYVDTITLSLSAAGTFTSVDKYTSNCSGHTSTGSDQTDGSWSTSGGKMTINDGDTTFSVTYIVTNSTLSVTFTSATESHTENYVRIASSGSGSEATAPSTPTFSPAGGTYTSSQTVAISCATSGAIIYYTLDGSEPTPSSSRYSAPITITSSKTIKAIAYKDKKTSSVKSATFTINTGSAGSGSSSLVGTWEAHESDSSGGSLFVMDVTVTFSANGVFIVSTRLNTDGYTQDTTQTGTWSASGGTLTTKLDGEEQATSSYAIHGGELTIGEEMVFTRVEGARVASSGSAIRSELSREAIQAWLGIDLQRPVSANTRFSH